MKQKLVSILSFLILICGCSTKTFYPKSDHYDGYNFFNPNGARPPEFGFWRGLKFWMTLEKSKWPDSVANGSQLRLNETLQENQVAVTYVNHATFLIQFNGLNILTDPMWSDRASPISWMGPLRVRKPAISIEKLPKIDLVLISHNHYDHLDLPTIKALNEKDEPIFIVPIGNKQLLKSIGVKNIEELDWWAPYQMKQEFKITSTPTQHFSGRSLWDQNETLWSAYLIEIKNHKIYFGGDCAYSDFFKETSKKTGTIDLSFLPIGAYEPNSFMKFAHLNPAEAVQAHLDLNSKKTIGMHFGTFQLSIEAIDQPIIDLNKALEEKKLLKSDFFTVKEGQTKILDL